jgi:hypothetical protein
VRVLLIISSVAAFCLGSQAVARSQQEVPFGVGPLGGVTTPSKPMKPPPDVAALLPHAKEIRVLARTRLSPIGESVVVYEDSGEDLVVRKPVVLIERSGTVLAKFKGADKVCQTASFSEFQADDMSRAAAFAFRCFGDGSGTAFAILAFDGKSYTYHPTGLVTEGKIEIVESNPARMILWQARSDLDSQFPEDSCVWCPHRYEIREFGWSDNGFELRTTKVTRGTFSPVTINEHPIVLRPRSKS